MKNAGTSNFVCNTHKKNSYVKLEEGAYPRDYIIQLQKALAALVTSDLRTTKVVRLNNRSGEYEVTIGFGKRNWWFKNRFIARGHVARFRTIEEAMKLLREIYKAAVAGEFDEALEELRIQRQEHAGLMIEKRNVCGFHRLPAPEPMALLEAPMTLLPAAESVPA